MERGVLKRSLQEEVKNRVQRSIIADLIVGKGMALALFMCSLGDWKGKFVRQKGTKIRQKCKMDDGTISISK